MTSSRGASESVSDLRNASGSLSSAKARKKVVGELSAFFEKRAGGSGIHGARARKLMPDGALEGGRRDAGKEFRHHTCFHGVVLLGCRAVKERKACV